MSDPHHFSTLRTPGMVHLRIMETSDLHVHVMPYDYYADKTCDQVGLARTATLITKARGQAANGLLLDNGDFLQGNPMGDYIAQSRGLRRGDVHPVFAAMNQLRYDAATLGNHEFNYGLDYLMTALEGAAFPVISANIALRLGPSPAEDATLLPPYVILDRAVTDGAGVAHPIRIGLIGFAPPQITQWDRTHLEGRVHTREIVEAATSLVPRMKAEGADIIIALSHSGIGPATASDGMENASTALAAIDGIDALVTGHSHLVFPSPAFAGMEAVDCERGTLCGKPAVMAGFYGSHLGVIDLLLERRAAGWHVSDFTAATHDILTRDVPSSATIEASVRDDHAATLAYARRPIGRTTVPLHTYFAAIAPSCAVRLVAIAQAAHVAKKLRGLPEAALPILSAAAPFKTGGRGGAQNYTNVPVGDMALRNAADLYIFPNTIAALRINGAEIADWLEHAVGIYNQIIPGITDQPLLDPNFPSYNFDMIHGVEFDIDLAQPARFDRHGVMLNPSAHRITNLCWQGVPLDPQAEFILATNSYRASGCGGFAGTTPARDLDMGRDNIRDILLRHIATAGTVYAPPAPEWRFTPLPDTSVTLDTAPQAMAHLQEVAQLGLQAMGPAPDGFARFRLTLG